MTKLLNIGETVEQHLTPEFLNYLGNQLQQ